jgi:hypothetical protein
MEAAFYDAAGYNAHEVALAIRGLLAALFSLWAIWVIYNQFKLVVTEQLTVLQWVFNSITTVFILTMILVLVGT